MSNTVGDNPGTLVANGCGCRLHARRCRTRCTSSHPTDTTKAFSASPVLQFSSVGYLPGGLIRTALPHLLVCRQRHKKSAEAGRVIRRVCPGVPANTQPRNTGKRGKSKNVRRCQHQTARATRCRRQGTLYVRYGGKEYLSCRQHHAECTPCGEGGEQRAGQQGNIVTLFNQTPPAAAGFLLAGMKR
jgi:hypothetical protein